MAGRPSSITPESIEQLLAFMRSGDTEYIACIGARVSHTSWRRYKKNHPGMAVRVAEARVEAAKAKQEQLRGARQEAQLAAQLAHGSTKRPPKKLKPTIQASKVAWRLANRVPLSVVVITPEHLREACNVMNYTVDAFMRQDAVFKLMKQVYERRAWLRGDLGVHRETKAQLFPQTAAYQKPVDWDKPTPDIPDGWSVGW